MTETNRPRTIAFYLPQYHPIQENDRWWGNGFTDWTNVKRALPAFEGHDQPRVPTDLGYYNLNDLRTLADQAELASNSGIDAFCFYWYWFDRHRLLERPVEAYAQSSIQMPYCLSWANEAWTRRWDGKHRDVLMPQSYIDSFDVTLFKDLLPHFRNSKYLTTVDGRPIFVVHRVDMIPNAKQVATKWRQLALHHQLPGIYLIAAETKRGLDPERFGFDAVAEFPPVGSNTLASSLRSPVAGLAADFRGRLLAYDAMVKNFTTRREQQFVRHRGVTPGWDNTARRGSRATIYVGSSPQGYGQWLRRAREEEGRLRGANGLIFVNAWNEWAEGAYIEPDLKWGTAYLEASRWDDAEILPTPESRPQGHWTVRQLRSISLCAGGSVLSSARTLRTRARRLISGQLL